MKFANAGRAWARRIKRDALTLWFAAGHPATPWPAKALGLFVIAYALSPIDLIPDFIPVLGYLDDVVLLPVLIWLAVRMLPPDVRHDCRQRAEAWTAQRKLRATRRWGFALVVSLWLLAAAAFWIWVWPAAARWLVP